MEYGIRRENHNRSINFCILIILLLSNLIGFQVVGQSDNVDKKPMNASLIVLGRSGSGISSTVQQLIGSSKTFNRPERLLNNHIEEFSIPLNSGGFLKIVDVDGLVDGKTLQADSEVLSSLNSYIKDPTEGLNNQYPNFFLIISTFDDTRYHGEQSLFIKTLKRVQMFQEDFFGNTTSNTALVLTKFLTATKAMQKRPQHKIEQFRDAIREFTSFPAHQIGILVGENLPEEYDLKVENGFTKLPNKDLYPKNVFDALIENATKLEDQVGVDSIIELMNSRNEPGQIYSKFYSQNPDQVENPSDFLAQIYQSNSGIRSSEIATALQEAYNNLNSSTFLQPMTELQLFFQSNNFHNLSQLPTTSIEKVKFFQKLTGLSSTKLTLLKEAFDLEVPEYIHSLVVGYGFDVTKDESLMTSPFKLNSLNPSPIGYRIPDIISCSKLLNQQQVDYTFYANDFSQYIPMRFKSLQFHDKNTFLTNGSFEGTAKSGFNVKSNESEAFVYFSATREIRVIQCELNNQVELDEEFIETVNNLEPFDKSDRESVAEWKEFFDQYGTHVVSLGFGGGNIHGSLGVGGQSLSEVINSTERINDILQSIVNFGELSVQDIPTYRFFGGYRDPQLQEIYRLDPNSRQALLKNWQNSLIFDPIILEYDLHLTQISEFVKLLNYTLAEEIEKSAELFLSGELKYERKKKPRPTATTTSPVVINNPEKSTTYRSKSTTTRHYQIPSKTTTPKSTPYPNSNEGHITANHTPAPRPPILNKLSTEFPINRNSGSLTSTTNSTPKIPACKKKKPKSCKSCNDRIAKKLSPIGYGYHALKDFVFSTTPFKMQMYESVTDKEANPGLPCSIINYKVFDTRDDYVIDRINTKFPITATNIYNAPQVFEGNIPPWVFTRDDLTNKFVWEEETRYYKQVRGLKKHIARTVSTYNNLNILNEEFISYAKSLPNFGPAPDCETKIAWRKFFNTYGTHYVVSAFFGYSYLNNTSLDGVNLKLFDTCVKFCHLDQEHWSGSRALRSSLEFEKLSMLFLNDVFLKISMDEAYFYLVSGKLHFKCGNRYKAEADPCCATFNATKNKHCK